MATLEQRESEGVNKGVGLIAWLMYLISENTEGVSPLFSSIKTKDFNAISMAAIKTAVDAFLLTLPDSKYVGLVITQNALSNDFNALLTYI